MSGVIAQVACPEGRAGAGAVGGQDMVGWEEGIGQQGGKGQGGRSWGALYLQKVIFTI